ncbi:MAG: IS21 family transposase [Lamprobacter sp.]|nr:IS21 family transposase [Lamprobacter sp.]MEA3643083.1 IS21 family transposase [Lamprobacter sp.]
MSSRKQPRTQAQASAKAGISERSARRIEHGELGGSAQRERHWRTRSDPFAEVWEEEIVSRLEQQPRLDATTLFEDLQDRHPGQYGNGKKRTFQRRVKAWKALHGADKEVIFRQVQEPGRQGLSDFTELKGLVVTIAGEALDHRLYHFRLAYSGWSHVRVVLGGESYSALAEGLQEALWRLGGAPLEHRTDSLSAAYKNLAAEAREDLTQRYEALCAHYGMTATRNNRGVSHENGAVESPHGHLKRRMAQALLLRDSADFATLQDYRQWLDALVVRFNRRCGEALAIERAQLQALPRRRTGDYSEQVVAVTTSATIEVKRVLYSVPARLIGERLRLHVFDERIEAFVGATRALTLPRVYSVNHERARRIDYRHLIGALVRKPQAFRYSQLREDLLPNATYRTIWQYLDRHLDARAACKRIVGILALAARAECEQALGAYLLERIAAGTIPTLTALESRFERRDAVTQQADLRSQPSTQHALSSYDHLLPAHGHCLELH